MNATTATTTTPRPETWGNIFDPLEFADYMAGKYDKPAEQNEQTEQSDLAAALDAIHENGLTAATVSAAHAAAERFLTSLDGKGPLTVPVGALVVCLESFVEGESENSNHFRNHYGNATARFYAVAAA